MFTSRQSEDVELTAFLCSEGCLRFRGKYDWSKHKVRLNMLKDANYNHLTSLSSFVTSRPTTWSVILHASLKFFSRPSSLHIWLRFKFLVTSSLCPLASCVWNHFTSLDWGDRRTDLFLPVGSRHSDCLTLGIASNCRPRFVPRVALLTVTGSHSSFRACACIGWQQLHWAGGRFKRVKDATMMLNLKSHDARGIYFQNQITRRETTLY